MSDWFQRLMGQLGYTRKDLARESLRLEKEAASYQRRVDQEKYARLAATLEKTRKAGNEQRKELENVNRWKARRIWQDPALAALPSFPPVPARFHEKTFDLARVFAPGISTLVDLARVDSFGGNEDARVFYWALARATYAAHHAATEHKSEDGISTAFLNALADEIRQQSQSGSEASLQIGLCAIYEHVKPAIKEAQVGADMLLVVSGDTLVPKGGARLFWIQAKRETASNPYVLNYHRPPNATEITQCEALLRVHETERGSFGVYALYSEQLPFVSSIFVSKNLAESSHDVDQCSISLANGGQRFQELIVAAAKQAASVGQFETTDAVIEYLDHASRQSIVPLKVVSVHSGTGLLESKRLVERLKAFYAERTLRQRQTQQRGRG
ncbi:hypothetical protein JVX96_00745 [Variovorax sp. PDNC026]|uniref:hypothetical protein n=1 Tax=Variovorax sp. PDNC026 TaxID=2811425 RepID=UPI0019655F4E|nr:hypothetical protein [Variovorax sp. PDNC026]QRY31889.1 hypothetical protein JVX96_00745 [Variovorax sp. PDNC026]